MKITICSSLSFIKEIGLAAEELTKLGHEVVVPKSAELVLNGEESQEQISREKSNGDIVARSIRLDAIRRHAKHIESSDAILVLNIGKKGIENYIGGNVFLEIGFAHVFNKKIFLLNDIPKMPYADEIRAMQPIILNGNLQNIK